MMRRMRGSRVALVVLACALAGCYSRRVTGDEVTELLSDTTVRGHHVVDDYDFQRTYHADGTFEQVQGPSGSGQWSVYGDDICIRWDPPYPKRGELCRRMMTDDDGAYWKELTKRNGRSKTVVRYESFIGPDGVDRRRIPAALERWRRWMSTWRGVVVIIVLAAVLLLVLRALRRGKDDPGSLRNRLHRRLFRIEAGGVSYRYSELNGLEPLQLRELLGACVHERRWVDAYWVTGALFRRATDRGAAIATLWRCVEPLDDDVAQRALQAVLDFLGDAAANINATSGDTRFAYLVGKAFAARAMTFQRSNGGRFEQDKKLALEHYEHVRAHARARLPT